MNTFSRFSWLIVLASTVQIAAPGNAMVVAGFTAREVNASVTSPSAAHPVASSARKSLGSVVFTFINAYTPPNNGGPKGPTGGSGTR